MLFNYRALIALNDKRVVILLFLTLFAKISFSQCSATAAFSHYFQQCSTVQFTDLSTAATNYNIVQWDWDFDDGNTSNLQNPVNTFPPGATYLVTLIVTADSSGVTCVDSVTNPVIVPNLPDVFFTWDPEPTCLGTATSFFGTSGSNIVSWYWDFGDGKFSNLQNPINLYLYAATFDVSLSVIDVNGCSDTVTHQITVVEIPDVDFTVNPNPTCVNALTDFSGTSTASITFWDWDFGDGGTANTQNASHAYVMPGIFTATLTVTDIYGCTNSTFQLVEVNPLPNPDFEHTAPACLNDSVFFTNFSTTPNGYIVEWDWDFGDGNSVTINFPDNPNVAHLYANNGTFQVFLTVTDSDSCFESTYRQIIIVPRPIADFTFSLPCDGDPVNFTDLSSLNGGSDIVTWYWEFGDPASGIYNTSNLQNPSHTFSSAGSFDVILIINNTDDCSDTITKTILVNQLPYVEIATDSDTACVEELINFYGSGTDIVSWLWDFGDGGTSVLQDPTHMYMTSGIYTVVLSVIDINGCNNDTATNILINPLPFADFNHSVPSCSGSNVDFFDLSSTPNGYIIIWHWYFGDGSDTIILFPDPPNVSHIYSTPGSYIVSLAIINSNGCIDSTDLEISIAQGPEAAFSNTGPQCEDNLIQFLDQSLGFGFSIQSWFWNFGDPSSGSNNTSVLQNPYHIYNNSGTYNVFLEVTSSNGCTDTITQDITIHPPPNVFFSSNPSTNCLNDTVYFVVDPDSTDIGAIAGYFWDFGDPSSGTSDTSSLQNPWHIFTNSGTFNVTLTVTDTTGCENSISIPVYINPIPTADFSFIFNCVNDSTRFYDQSLPASSMIQSWFWEFDDPASAPYDTSSQQNPYHKFSDIGQYFTTLTVTDAIGCTDNIMKYVTIFDNPVAYYSFEQVCNPPGTVYFTDSSFIGQSGSPLQEWLWELDEGFFSTAVNPQYIYGQLDTCYIVTLTVTDVNQCTNTYVDTVCLFDVLSVSFNANRVCYGQRTVFNTSYTPSNDSVVIWRWDFGDGTPPLTTIFDTASHVYGGPGTYLVELIVTDIHNCTASTFHQVTVDSLPIPRFAFDTTFCNTPTHFFDQSIGGGAFINSWYWDFGDITSGPSNYSTLPNPSHAYQPVDSTYYVTLIVTNANGCIDSITQPVIKGPCLVSGFDVSPYPLCMNANICFYDNSVLLGSGGIINQWDWNFGDGNTSTYYTHRDSICHQYVSPGNFTVTLIITAQVQGITFSDTTTHNILIYTAPGANFTFEAPCTNHNTQFINESIGNGSTINTWAWNFGDPTTPSDTSSAKDPTYRYPGIGHYFVQLIAINNYGCTDTILDTIEIFPPPIADYNYNMACAGNQTNFLDFSDTSGVTIERWHWNFGDPNSTRDTSTIRNPTYTYDTSGIYNVELIIRDFNFCYDTMIKEVEVYPIPTSAFSIIDNYMDMQGQIKCQNSSEGAVYYEWDFGNGYTSELENPVTQYTESGIYLIQLVSWNQYDCPDTTSLEYELLYKGLYIPNAFHPTSTEAELKIFQPKGYNLQSYLIEIYSLWGNILWKSSLLNKNGEPKEGWDGIYKEKPMPSGTYVWKAKANFKDNSVWPGMDDGNGNFKKTGSITLIR